jgi:hypothetical protein
MDGTGKLVPLDPIISLAFCIPLLFELLILSEYFLLPSFSMTITKTVFLPFSLPCSKCNYSNSVEHTYTWPQFEILCMLYSSWNFRYFAANKNLKKNVSNELNFLLAYFHEFSLLQMELGQLGQCSD